MKSGLRLLLIAVALSLVLASCGQATPAPAPATPAPAATPRPAAATPAPAPAATRAPAATPRPAAAPAPAAGPIGEMKLLTHTWGGPRAFTKGWEWWAEQVTEKTGGAVTFDHFYSEALGGAKDQADNIKSGLFDLGPIYPGYAPGKTPLFNVVSLAGLTDDYGAMSKALAEISALPEMQAELKVWNAKFIFGATVPTYAYMGKKPVHSVADLEGLRLRTVGEQAKLAEKLGVIPISMPAPEIYEALDRGTIEGAFFPWSYAFGAYGLWEVSDYAALVGLGATVAPVAFNLDAWNKVDPRVQKIMLDVAAQVPDYYVDVYAEADAKWIPMFKDKGMEIVEFSAEEKAKLQAVGGKPLWDIWAQNQGPAGRKVLDAFLAAIAKYEK